MQHFSFLSGCALDPFAEDCDRIASDNLQRKEGNKDMGSVVIFALFWPADQAGARWTQKISLARLPERENQKRPAVRRFNRKRIESLRSYSKHSTFST